MKSSRVLFVSTEITPYLPENDISILCRYLPQGVQEQGKEIRTFMPRFGLINERRNQLHEVIRLSGMNLIINDTDHPLVIKVASIPAARMQVYFIDNEDYFHRKQILKDDNGQFFEDNDERAIFYARGVLETVRKLRWSPDIIHCQGWFTSLVPLYVKKLFKEDPLFANTKVVFTVYNDEFPAPLDSTFKKKVILEGIKSKDVEQLSDPTYVNLIKFAYKYSDGMIIGSESINNEVAEFLKTCDKPVLEYQGMENYVEAYTDFYDQIFDKA
jgi:starch synthase